MTTPVKPLVLELARRGEFIDFPSAWKIGATDRFMVLRRCESPSLLNAFFCETCQVTLRNVGQLEIHLEVGGRHRIAVLCDKHRVYEEAELPPAVQLGARL